MARLNEPTIRMPCAYVVLRDACVQNALTSVAPGCLTFTCADARPLGLAAFSSTLVPAPIRSIATIKATGGILKYGHPLYGLPEMLCGT